MNIETFIAQMNGEHKEAVIQKHITRQYVPFEEKVAVAKKIIQTACYKEMPDANGVIQKVFWVDSIQQQFLTFKAIVEMYTDLTFSANPVKDYNTLLSKKYDTMIFEAIPAEDAESFMNIIGMVYDDEYENVNSIQGRIKNFLLGFDNIIQSAMSNMLIGEINGGSDNAKVELQGGGIDNGAT